MRIYLGAYCERVGCVNFWIDGNAIVRQYDMEDIYARLKEQYGQDFVDANNEMIKSSLYGDISEERIANLSCMRLSWIRKIIIDNRMETVTQFRQFIYDRGAEGFDVNGASIHTVDQFICRSKVSRFVNEDRKDGVFDQVVVEMPLIQGDRTRKEMMNFIRQYKKAIKLKAVDTLKNSRKYDRYGVPVNFLKYERMVLTRDNVLEITFVLKIEAE